MTSQMTPQSSPSDPRKQRKIALELQLKLKKEALANMQQRVSATEQEILKLRSQKEGRLLLKRRASQDSREVDEVSDSGSEWSGDEPASSDEHQRNLSC